MILKAYKNVTISLCRKARYLNEWQTAAAQWLTAVFRPADTTTLPKTGY